MAPANLEALVEEARAAIAATETPDALTQVRARYLGRKGSVAQVLRGIGKLAAEERAKTGEAANVAKASIEALVEAHRESLARSATAHALQDHQVDVTLPGAGPPAGHLHPITHVVRDMVGFFASMVLVPCGCTNPTESKSTPRPSARRAEETARAERSRHFLKPRRPRSDPR